VRPPFPLCMAWDFLFNVYSHTAGEGDTVCCFSCGVEMSNWTTVENIWVRHARQSPNCQLLIREKGQDFINDVIDEHGRYVVPAKEPVINVSSYFIFTSQ